MTNDKYMKRSISSLIQIIIFLILGFITISAQAQSIAFSYKGDWSSWDPIARNTYSYNFLGPSNTLKISRYTDMSGIILTTSGGREILSFRINNFKMPDKKERKEHMKTGQWFSYYGTVDYYVNDAYPTAEAIAKRSYLVIPNSRTDETPSVKRHTICEIRIAPFKKEPEVWNVFFDNIGIGISTKDVKFKK